MMDIEKVKYFILMLLSYFLMLFLTGCKTRYMPVESIRTEWKEKTVVLHDTVRDTVLSRNDIYRHDSMAVRLSGDTVYVDRWHTLRLVSQEKKKSLSISSMADSTAAVKADSIIVPYPVEKKLTRWEQVRMDIGSLAVCLSGVAIIFVIAYAAIWIRRKIRGNV